MSERHRNVPLLTAVVATVVALALVLVHAKVAPLPGLAALEGLTVDARFRLRGPRAPATDRIVIVGFDDKLRQAAPDVIQTRRGYARFVDALTAYDPKLVAFDVFFSSPEVVLPDPLAARVRALDQALRASTDPALAEAKGVIADVTAELRGDEVLAAAIARSKRIFLGALFVLGGKVAEAAEPIGLAAARHGEVADAGGGGKRRPPTAQRVITTLPEIGKGLAGAGAVNSVVDKDGVTRRMYLAIEHAGRLYMSLGLAVALAELGKPGDTTYIVGDATMNAGGVTLPVGEAGTLQLDVLGRNQIPVVSAADVLAGTAPRDALRGKVVFVGFTYSAFDKVATPLDSVTDGVELHATLAENILTGHLMRDTGDLALAIATLLLCGVVCGAQLRPVRRRPWVPPLIALAAIALYVGFALVMFARGTVIAIAVPAVLASCVLVAATIGALATEGREKAKLRAVFSQYVAGPVVDRILADPARAKLGGERKDLTVLFSDIRGFSLFAETMPPEALAAFLSEYLTPMTELVLASGGTLDKYIGDAIMAIWGAPIDDAGHAAHACDVALKMQAALVGLEPGVAEVGQARGRDRDRHQHRADGGRQHGLGRAVRLHRARRPGEPRLAARGADQGVRDRDPRRRGDRDGRGRGLRVPGDRSRAGQGARRRGACVRAGRSPGAHRGPRVRPRARGVSCARLPHGQGWLRLDLRRPRGERDGRALHGARSGTSARGLGWRLRAAIEVIRMRDLGASAGSIHVVGCGG